LQAIGKTFWRELLAQDLATARRVLPSRIAATDELIQRLRSGAAVEPAHKAIPRELAKELLRGRPAGEIYHDPCFTGDEEEAELLSDLPPLEIAGFSPVLFEDLVDLGVRLKRPRPQTVLAWQRAVEELRRFAGVDANYVDRELAQRFRDHLLDKGLKISTIKTRINYIKGLFNLAVEEGVLDRNPFVGVVKRLSVSQPPREAVDIQYADSRSMRLGSEYLIYQLLRWTGCRLAEILGIEIDDVDLQEGVLHIREKTDRPLKTPHSARVVPIHTHLLRPLEELSAAGNRPFEKYYDPATTRWGGGITWSKTVGCSPHSLRHHATSSMRSAGISETVIGAVLGHAVPGMTARYGTVSIELKRQAITSIQ